MAEFITGEQLAEVVYNIIFEAKKSLIIVSPYIKLDDYFKKEVFNSHKNNADLHLIVAFGKNEQNPRLSLNRDDFEYFKEFNNVSIVYIPNLHAKFYANENKAVVTSINLYDYSFKNNIEFGVISKSNLLELGTASIDSQARKSVDDMLNNGFCVFVKRPQYRKKLLIGRDYVGSQVLFDITEDLIRGKRLARRSISEFEKEEFVDSVKPKERITRDEFELKTKASGKLLSGSALARIKGKKLADVREVMAKHDYVQDNKITAKGRALGITLKYAENGESWIVYPESLSKLL